MTLNAGTQLGPYEIVGPLGAGGMGEVYRAKDTRLDREVAVKVLPERLAGDPNALARFEREAKAVAALSHPNILAVHDVGTAPPAGVGPDPLADVGTTPLAEVESDPLGEVRAAPLADVGADPFASPLAKGGPRGVSYVVMELLEGETLRERVRRSPIPWRKAIEYGAAIADGLAAAHSKGIIHRDLKPENVFLTKDGVVKILDFGLARMETPDSPRRPAGELTITLDTKTGVVMGTPPYMSPEQTRGEPADSRSDIFSFGCLLYEMVTGRQAFARETPADVSAAILKEEPAEINAITQGVPAEFQRIIRHCLEKKPPDRFQSARDLAFDLKALSAVSGASRAVPVAGRRQLWASFWMATGAILVAVAALLVGLNPGGWRQRLVGRPQVPSIRSLAVLPLENLSGDPKQEYFASTMTGELITTLGKIKALRVIARRSVMEYKDTDKSPAEIGRELNVSALVDGTITRVGDQVRITANLIEAATSEQLWGHSYERDMSDILAMQGEIARAIAAEIQVKLTPQEQQRLASTPLVNTDAYNAYLRGLNYLRTPDQSEEQLELAIGMFERAVALDPAFAVAYAQLARAHSGIHHFGYDPTEGRSAMAKAAVDRALELQPDLPEAHLALGYYHYWCHRDYPLALEAFAVAKKALPNDSELLFAIAAARRRQGEFEVALEHFREAFVLSPRDARLPQEIGNTLTPLRKYAPAQRYYDRAISLAPDQVYSYVWNAEVHWLEHGDTRSARAVLEAMPTSRDPYSVFGWFRQELFERDYPAALRRLASAPGESIADQAWFIPKPRLAALVYRLMEEPQRARASCDAARVVLEKEVNQRPEDHRLRSSLGIAYAGLGRKEDAIREGKLAVDLFPVSKDALLGPYRVEDLAYIYVLVREYDAALDQIEYLLSIPCEQLSVPKLRLDPRWDPLRNHPRYQELLQRHALKP